MTRQILFVSVLCFGLSACQSRPSDESAAPQRAPVAQPAYGQYIVTGGVSDPGPRQLVPGDTVAMVVARSLRAPPREPITIVLIRHAPEGTTRQLIQLDAHGQLMDEKQDVTLRNGDELIFPGGKGSNATGNPSIPAQRGPG